MSISTEITRLENAKSAIKAAIEGKGVTVPDGTLLDGMAALIESIEAGGGEGVLPTPFTNITTGTFTLASLVYCNNYPITHGLGIVPTLFAVYNDVNVSQSGSVAFVIYLAHSNRNTSQVGAMANSKGNVHDSIDASKVVVDENTFTYNDSTSYFGSNRQFRWVALG